MIPKCISDINHDWITDLMKKLHPQWASEPETDAPSLTSLKLSTSACDEELFECYRLSFWFENDQNRYWMVKLMPSDPDLRDIVLRHDLFKKEMLVHQEVVPQLKEFAVKSQGMIYYIIYYIFVGFEADVAVGALLHTKNF